MRNKRTNGTKRGVVFTLLMFFGASLVFAESMEGKDRKIFDSGIKSALKVLKYEKGKSLNTTNLDIRGKYCISLNRSGSKPIKPFDVVKMESLSLYLEYAPMYLLHSINGESNNIFCFAQGDTKKEAKAKLKAIQARYPKIDEYNPMVTILQEEGEYKRTIPFLGVWSKDMSQTVELLNQEIEQRNKTIAIQKRSILNIEKEFSKFSKFYKNVSSSISKAKKTISSKKVKKNKEEDDDLSSDFSLSTKQKMVSATKDTTPKRRIIKKLSAKKIIPATVDSKIEKSKESERVFTIKK